MINKHIIYLLLILCLFNAGCSNYYWANNRNNANWNVESSQCKAYANSVIPDPAMMQYDYGRSFSGGGVIGSTPYMYSGTISPDYGYNMQAGLNNAANAFIALGARQNAYESCLKSLGWYQVKKEDVDNKRTSINNMRTAMNYLKSKNFTEAVRILKSEVKKGNIVAEAWLGSLYVSGEGVEKNYTKAKELFENPARQGNSVAEYGLGMLYLQGNGVNKDIAKAEYWLEKSANHGNSRAQAALGTWYISNQNSNKNILKAKDMFEESTKKGDMIGQLGLSILYYKGDGVEKDYIRSRKLAEESANQGFAPAMNQLGYFYLEGKGVEKDYDKSLEYFNKSIENGYIEAYDSIGELYEKGFKNKKTALEFYEKACQKGVKVGCDNYKRLSQMK